MRKSIWLLSAGFAVLATPSYAQDTQGSSSTTAEGPSEAAAVDQPKAEDEQKEGDAIIVTATRRNEALSDVPLAVSAVSGDTLKKTGATDLRGLNQVSPSLFVFSTSSEGGAARANIRGIGTVGDNPGLESSVATFIDGVYRSRTGVGLTELGAVDRIEVLRGPQGTLFGRNASAGLIHVITAKPRFTQEIYGEASIGNYGYKRLDLGATGPITDSLAARIDGVWIKRDGFLDDVVGGGDYNDRNRYMVRGQLLYQPNDDLSVRFIADYTHRNEQCCAAVYQPTEDKLRTSAQTYLSLPSTFATIIRGLHPVGNPDLNARGIILDDPYDRKISVTPGRSFNSDTEDWGASLEANYDFGGAQLTSITAYRSNDFERGQDADFNNLDILYRDGSGGSYNKFKTFTQELRFQGELWGGRLNWLVGGYYAHENLKLRDNLTYGNDYSQYANCVVANSFAGTFVNAGNLLHNAGLVALGNGLIDTNNATNNGGTCFNTNVANAMIGTGLLTGANLLTFQAFSKLGAFAGGTTSGFTNLTGRTFTGVGLDDLYDQDSDNFAIFTHNIFEITKGLKLTVGLRYTHEKKTLDAHLTDNNLICEALSGTTLASLPCLIPSVPGHDYSFDDSKTEHKFSGTAVLSWKPIDEILMYASYSKGYKAGGFNLDRSALARAFTTNLSTHATVAGAVCGTGPGAGLNCTHAAGGSDLQFDPELNDAWELGLKYNGRGIDINLALFRQDFKDFQLNTFNGLNFEVENVNSCSSLDVPNGDTDVNDPVTTGPTGACVGSLRSGVRSTGLEIEVFTRPFRYASFNVGMTYARTRYRDNLVGASGEPLSGSLFQLSNAQVSGASELVTTASFGYTPPIGSNGMHGLFYIDARQMSGFNTGSDLDVEKFQKGFGVINGRIGISGPNDLWGVELWAQNLLDTKFKQVAFDAPLQGGCTENGALNGFCGVLANYPVTTRSQQLYADFLGEPRTFGLTIKGKLGQPRPRMVEAAPPAPPPPPPAPMQTCADGSVIEASATCPSPPPPPPPAPAPERG
ncbi:TonB-dependent receptor [Sphingomonas alba]|uniref:TonB-dependent receptor n=1 Tax=Sphingomonas alba TaxID=2908208 RepID=A0ABT0RM20_9SPHN|nr:TonB-dependent receptor [Sphingomonas alba]MCL6683691.1 TonB-dependent receptor [Sphingomonas alba]